MDDPWKELLDRLDGAIDRLDREEAGRVCFELTGRLHKGDVLPAKTAAGILGRLRRKRYFELIEQLAETFRFAGIAEPRVRRQYAQALIDLGRIEKAIDTLEALENTTRDTDPGENREARGLLGRVYKQLYINAVNANPAMAGSALVRAHLQRALTYYLGVYDQAPTELWHGINAVAIVCRAAADGVPLDGAPDAKQLAATILDNIAHRRSSGEEIPTWDLATAVEACVALGKGADALAWLSTYIDRTDADAFELTSTRRQLKEVWRLEPDRAPGSTILPILENALLRRAGGRIEVTGPEVKSTLDEVKFTLEKTLGPEGAVSLAWYRAGLERCSAIAQVCTRLGEAVGTGFLLRASDVDTRWDSRSLLLTNAHVVSDATDVRAKRGAVHPDDASVTFEVSPAPNQARKRAFKVKKLLWTSPPEELDATLLLLTPLPTGAEPLPLAREVPAADGKGKVYVIGHPKGGGLALSIYDNLLLDLQGPLMHYRTPTESGSSGSPVFDANWCLIGLHHGYRSQVPGPSGPFAANEGIALRYVLEAVRQQGLQLPNHTSVRKRAARR